MVALGISAVDHLHLQLQQLLAHVLRIEQIAHAGRHPGEQGQHLVVQGKGPSHQGPLAHVLVLGHGVDLGQGQQPFGVALIHGPKHEGRDQQLGIGRVDRGRDEQLGHVATEITAPLMREDHGVEQPLRIGMVGVVDGAEPRLPGLVGLQRAHGHVRDKGLKLPADGLGLERQAVAVLHMNGETGIVGRQAVELDVAHQPVKPPEQLPVELLALGVGIAP